MKAKIQELESKIAEAQLGGGQKRIDSQHKKGKLTARERITLLMDPGSFEEIGALVLHRTKDFGMDSQQYYGDGVITLRNKSVKVELPSLGFRMVAELETTDADTMVRTIAPKIKLSYFKYAFK